MLDSILAQFWPRFEDTIKVGTRKAYPHLLYSKIWRWNQIKTHSDIIGVCHYGFAKACFQIAISISEKVWEGFNLARHRTRYSNLKTNLSNCNTFVWIHFTIFSKEKFWNLPALKLQSTRVTRLAVMHNRFSF